MAGHDGALHEALGRDEQIAGSSNRRFGNTFAVVFLLIGLLLLWRYRADAYYWLIASGVFALIAALAPRILTPANKAWTKFAIVLSEVTTPIVMGLLFFGLITPIARFVRRKDPLRLRRDPTTSSYWIIRDPPGPTPESFKRQF